MDFGGFAAIPPGMPHAMGVVPKITRGVMRRNVDYTSSVIAHLQVSFTSYCCWFTLNIAHYIELCVLSESHMAEREKRQAYNPTRCGIR